MMLAATALATMALVAQDPVALRAAPSATAAAHAQLFQGELLEVRGQRLDHLQVYDHRRERAGFVRASQLRPISLTEADAPQLLAVLRFLRDAPGSEALGIAYAAAYLKAVPANQLNAEPFDAIGRMAERLAQRASQRGARSAETVTAHLEVAGQYGVKFQGFERDGAVQLCYDGEAYGRVLALAAASAEQRARATLALTRADCIDPALRPHERLALDRERAALLDRFDADNLAALDEPTKNRLRLRRAAVWSALAFQRARGGEAAAQPAARRALDELAAVNRQELADDDQTEQAEAALRVGAARWAALPAPAAAAGPGSGRPALQLQPGEPGQTCVLITDPTLGGQAAPVRRCTWGVVFPASARSAPDGDALALAVQPLEGWRELWLFRRQAGGWTVDVLPPAASEPGLGYIEFAGWVPGQRKLLLAREARVDGRLQRRFEVMDTATLAVEKSASTPSLLVLFGKWQDPAWLRQTVSLR